MILDKVALDIASQDELEDALYDQRSAGVAEPKVEFIDISGWSSTAYLRQGPGPYWRLDMERTPHYPLLAVVPAHG